MTGEVQDNEKNRDNEKNGIYASTEGLRG